MQSLSHRTLAAVLTCGLVSFAATTVARAEPGPVGGARAARVSSRDVTIPAGTPLRLRLETSHASNTSRVEDRVQAHLIAPVVVDGVTVLPVDTDAIGLVTSARPSGKVKGRGYLSVRFNELRADHVVHVTTRPWAREAPGTKEKDALEVGVPAGVGGVVGGIVGGKKGAAIGAGVGAGAGTGVVLSTAGKEVRLPRGSTVIVRLAAPVTVRLPR